MELLNLSNNRSMGCKVIYDTKSAVKLTVGGLNAYFEISDEMFRWCCRADTFTGYLNRIMLVLRLKINRKEVEFFH